jgi:hypothetical protein
MAAQIMRRIAEIFVVYLLLVFGFDNHKPPEVSILYPFHICNNLAPFDGWASAKKIHDSLIFIFF